MLQVSLVSILNLKKLSISAPRAFIFMQFTSYTTFAKPDRWGTFHQIINLWGKIDRENLVVFIVF